MIRVGEHTPMRIAALQPSISIVLEQLDALELLVACTKYCVEAVPRLRSLAVQVIADSWSSTSEEILSARPNLVLASVPYRMESLAAILKAGCPVFTLAPHTLADICADVQLIGNLIGYPERAAHCVAEFRAGIAAVAAQAEHSGARPLVYAEEWGKPLIHSQHWVAELVEAAGGRGMGTPGVVTDAAAVAAADPEVLVFAWCGAGDRVPLKRVIEQRGWEGLRAVRTGRVYCVPDEWLNTPAPTLLHGLHALAAAIHPDRFEVCKEVRSIAADPNPVPSI